MLKIRIISPCGENLDNPTSGIQGSDAMIVYCGRSSCSKDQCINLFKFSERIRSYLAL